jgi:hypothetical protein
MVISVTRRFQNHVEIFLIPLSERHVATARPHGRVNSHQQSWLSQYVRTACCRRISNERFILHIEVWYAARLHDALRNSWYSITSWNAVCRTAFRVTLWLHWGMRTSSSDTILTSLIPAVLTKHLTLKQSDYTLHFIQSKKLQVSAARNSCHQASSFRKMKKKSYSCSYTLNSKVVRPRYRTYMKYDIKAFPAKARFRP